MEAAKSQEESGSKEEVSSPICSLTGSKEETPPPIYHLHSSSHVLLGIAYQDIQSREDLQRMKIVRISEAV